MMPLADEAQAAVALPPPSCVVFAHAWNPLGVSVCVS